MSTSSLNQLKNYAEIVLDVPLRKTFTYSIPGDLNENLAVGDMVLVPFGRQKKLGFCFGLHNQKPTEFEAKDILQIAHPKILSTTQIDWVKRCVDFYQTSPGQVLTNSIPSYFWDVKNLKKEKLPTTRGIKWPKGSTTDEIELTSDQQTVVQDISQFNQEFSVHLIHGVTGSGKTEVYIELFKKNLKQGLSCLFLVPEIGLTPQMLSRLHSHFPDQLLVMHSGLTPNQKITQWLAAKDSTPKVLVGTRSALFAPFEKLGLIVLDEEQDTSYKQDSRFRYHARDVAIIRGKSQSCPVILGSATPSLETYYLSQQKIYHYHQIKTRFGNAKFDPIKVIDFQKEREQTESPLYLSKAIHDEIDECLTSGQQVLLYVGQRGHSQNAYCVSCEEIQLCPNCSVGLTYHKPKSVLKCHYCEYEQSFDEICLTCKTKSLALIGFGTQSIEEEVLTWHPKIKLSRLDSDVATTAGKLHAILDDFYNKKIHLLLGTQMIAKGHDFANVGLVAIVGLDSGLGLPDFRSGEKTFQTLVQVAGRGGRRDNPCKIIVQSFNPKHPSLQFGINKDYKGMAEWELEARKSLMYPPFARLVQVRFLSTSLKDLERFLNDLSHHFLGRLLQEYSLADLRILGPVDLPLAKIQGKYRKHVLFKVRRGLKLQSFLNYIHSYLELSTPAKISYQVDVDPMSLL